MSTLTPAVSTAFPLTAIVGQAFIKFGYYLKAEECGTSVNLLPENPYYYVA